MFEVFGRTGPPTIADRQGEWRGGEAKLTLMHSWNRAANWLRPALTRANAMARPDVESLLYSALLMGLQTGWLIYRKFIIVSECFEPQWNMHPQRLCKQLS